MNFPDSRIGASLKRAGASLNPMAKIILPRFANRGLIEARRTGISIALAGPLPRFANRGLIEARALW